MVYVRSRRKVVTTAVPSMRKVVPRRTVPRSSSRPIWVVRKIKQGSSKLMEKVMTVMNLHLLQRGRV